VHKTSNMVRLLYITNSLSAYSETFIWNTVASLSQISEIKLTIATTQSKDTSPNSITLKEPFLMSYCLSALRKVRLTKIANNIFDYWLNRKLKNVDYDIVWIDFGDNAAKMFKSFNHFGKKVIVHLHGYDASKLLFNVIYRNKLNDLSQENIIIVPSRYNRKRLVLSGCNENNIYVIPYAFHDKIKEYEMPKIRSGNQILLFAGRFVPKKDPRILIYAFREVLKSHISAELVMIGDGELLKDVISLVKEFKLEKKVKILGSQNHQNVLNWMRTATVYVQHSVTSYSGDQEGFPNSILEAQCCGLPVVSTIHAGIPEIVHDGETGYLVQEFDFEKMAERISYLLAEPQLINKMGRRAVEINESSALPEKRIQKIVQLITKES
jgi:colanic acid/amylovoran biosynthesis glycosyltransferase